MTTNTRGRYAAPRKPRTRSTPFYLLAALAAGLLLLAGACADTGPTGADPEPTVTVTAEPVVETETLEVTPAVCIEALDAAERITHENTVPAFEAMSDAMFAAAAFDTAGIEAATVTIETLTDEMGPLIDDYNAAATACRLLTEG